MSTEQHKAEMTMLHRNQMEGQSRLKNRIKYWNARKEKLIQQCGSIDGMNEREKMNYDVIQATIEDIEFFEQTLNAFALKYQYLYDKQCQFVENIFKVKMLPEDYKKLEVVSPEIFVETLKNIFDGKDTNH